MPIVTKQTAKPTNHALQPKTVSGTRSAWDLPAGIKLLLYGQSGSGKTTCWATFPAPILCLTCSGGMHPGELRSIDTPENRKRIDARIVDNVGKVREMLADAGQFATVVLDHVTGLQDLTLKEILGVDELPAQKGWGLATQQQWGQSTAQCKDMLRIMLSLPGNVVIVGQERSGKEDVQSDVQLPTVGVAVTPSLAGWLNPAVDYIFHTYKRPRMEQLVSRIGKEEVTTERRGKGVDFCCRTGPHDVYTTKFRGARRDLPEYLADMTYAKILALVQGK